MDSKKKSNLSSHQKVHNENCPKPFKCSKCDFVTADKNSLKGHLKTHKSLIERCEECNKNIVHECRLKCRFCDKKFTHQTTVLNHIKKQHADETEMKLLECDICGLKFSRKQMLKNHMTTKHADGKIQTFTCDVDGKTFKLKDTLVQHMTIHLPPIKCDFCHKMINIRTLKGHIKRLHTGIKQPSKRSIPKSKQCGICSKILSDSTSYRRHVKEHNKNLKCKLCDKLFGVPTILKDHIRDVHENLKKYSCSICDKKFPVPAKSRGWHEFILMIKRWKMMKKDEIFVWKDEKKMKKKMKKDEKRWKKMKIDENRWKDEIVSTPGAER